MWIITDDPHGFTTLQFYNDHYEIGSHCLTVSLSISQALANGTAQMSPPPPFFFNAVN